MLARCEEGKQFACQFLIISMGGLSAREQLHGATQTLQSFTVWFPDKPSREGTKLRFCIYPLHYNIINHRDKGEKDPTGSKKGEKIEKEKDNDASAFANFWVEILFCKSEFRGEKRKTAINKLHFPMLDYVETERDFFSCKLVVC